MVLHEVLAPRQELKQEDIVSEANLGYKAIPLEVRKEGKKRGRKRDRKEKEEKSGRRKKGREEGRKGKN